MKTVFSSHSEVAHVWASQSQETGSANNVSFRGTTIYSYGWWAMAKIANGVCFIRNWNYSASTSKHLSHVRRAVSHLETVRCAKVDEHMKPGLNEINAYNISQLLTEAKNALTSFANKRTRNKVLYFNDNQAFLQNAIRYAELMQCKTYLKNISRFDIQESVPNWSEVIERQKEKEAEREAKAAEKRRKRLDEVMPELLDQEQKWMDGEVDKTSARDDVLGFVTFPETRLRIKGEEVETSRGAKVPIREAKILNERLKAGKDVKGWRVGHYTVISVNGVLTIGCHKISQSELMRFRTKYGW